MNSEYIKHIYKFWGEIYSENFQLFEFFTDFNLLSVFPELDFFVRVNKLSGTHFSP